MILFSRSQSCQYRGAYMNMLNHKCDETILKRTCNRPRQNRVQVGVVASALANKRACRMGRRWEQRCHYVEFLLRMHTLVLNKRIHEGSERFRYGYASRYLEGSFCFVVVVEITWEVVRLVDAACSNYIGLVSSFCTFILSSTRPDRALRPQVHRL